MDRATDRLRSACQRTSRFPRTRKSAAERGTVPFPADGQVVTAIHTRDDELWYALQGEFRFKAGGRMFAAASGDLVFGPRGKPHASQNVTNAPGRLLVITTPAGLEGFFEDFSKSALGSVDAQALADIGHACGVNFVGQPLSISDPLVADEPAFQRSRRLPCIWTVSGRSDGGSQSWSLSVVIIAMSASGEFIVSTRHQRRAAALSTTGGAQHDRGRSARPTGLNDCTGPEASLPGSTEPTPVTRQRRAYRSAALPTPVDLAAPNAGSKRQPLRTEGALPRGGTPALSALRTRCRAETYFSIAVQATARSLSFRALRFT